MKALKAPSGWSAFYRVVRKIPFGKVSTYGAIAELANRPRAARHVGYALAALKRTVRSTNGHDVPWQRVLGAHSKDKAKITIKDPVGGGLQRALLEAEGVEFDARGYVSLIDYGWRRSHEVGPKRRPAPGKRSK